MESLDEWFPGVILKRIERPVPHTNISLKSFDVRYDISADQVETEYAISSDRLRLVASETSVEINEKAPDVTPPVINDITGSHLVFIIAKVCLIFFLLNRYWTVADSDSNHC